MQSNDQVTRTDLKGMDWFFNFNNPTYQLSVIRMVPSRYASYLLSPQEINDQINLFPVILDAKDDITIPWHFGYDELGELRGVV